MKRAVSCILFLALLVSLTACGGNPAADPEDSIPSAEPETVPEETVSPEPEAVPEKTVPPDPEETTLPELEEPTHGLAGQWKQLDVKDGDEYYGAVIDGEKIELHLICDNGGTRYLYWAGSFVPPPEESEGSYSWTSQVGNRRIDKEAIAASEGTHEFTYENGQLSCSVVNGGMETTILMGKEEWEPGLGISQVPDELVSSFDPATNQKFTYTGITFSYPAHFTDHTAYSDSAVYFYQPEHPDYLADLWLGRLDSGDKSIDEEEFHEIIPDFIDGLLETKKDRFDAEVKEATVAGQPAYIYSYRKYSFHDGQVLTTSHDAYIYNPTIGDVTYVRLVHGDGDMSGYDYGADFLKILDSAQLAF